MSKIEEQTKFYNSKAEKTGWRDFIGSDFINLPSCQAAQLPNFRNRKAIAFTMAEILISLTIIGVIAAITLPSLRANINEKTWATQKKAFHSRMSQAISMMPSLNGYGIVMNTDGTVNGSATKTNAAQAFITDGLSKVIKINNICDKDHLSDCGFNSKFKTLSGTKISFPKTTRELNSSLAGTVFLATQPYESISLIETNAVAFVTPNGESTIAYYQPNCRYWTGEQGYFQPYLCANFIVDLNGKRGPNTFNKDIFFMSVFYPTDSHVVMPEVHSKDSAERKTYAQTVNVCRSEKTSNLRTPNIEELASIIINQSIIGNINAFSTYASVNKWRMMSAYMILKNWDQDGNIYVRCVKR